MANCPNCNFSQPDGAIFCERCGTMLNTSVAANAPLEPPLITRLRQIGASGVMSVLVILYTVMLGIQLVDSFVLFASGSISLPIVPIIICIALWTIYLTAKKPNGSLVSTGGVTALFVLQILNAVLSGLCALLSMLCTAIFGIASGSATLEAELGSELSTVMLVCMVLFGVIFVFMLLNLLISIWGARFYSGVRNTLQTGFPYCKSAAVFGVFMLLGGIFSLVLGLGYIVFSSALGGLMQNLVYGLESLVASIDSDIRMATDIYSTLPGMTAWIFSGVQTILAGVCSILASVMIFKYRKVVKE